MKSRKWRRTEVIELPDQDKIGTLGEKKTHRYLEILKADNIKHAKRKKTNRIPQENEKTTRNQTT